MNTRLVPALIAVLFLGAACGAGSNPSAAAAAWANEGPRDIVPIVVSSDLAAGPNRFLVTVADRQNKPVASPDFEVALQFWDLAAGFAKTPAVSEQGTYMSVLPDRPGLYRAAVDFPKAGQWGLEMIMRNASGTQLIGRVAFPVHETSTTPAIGAPAPATETPTATTADQIHGISTDDDPDPDFYTTSVKQALAAHEPFMVTFATPAFCQTATCGPALDVVKSVAADYKDKLTFIHVEPYQLQMTNGQLQPVFNGSDPVPVQSTLDWGLPTEPYAFVVDADGKVTAKFEGIAGADELRAALDQVAK